MEDSISEKMQRNYRKKHELLQHKYNVIDKSNEQLVWRINLVREELENIRRQKRFLVRRLECHGDRFRDVCLEIPDEEPTPLAEDIYQAACSAADALIASGSHPGDTPFLWDADFAQQTGRARVPRVKVAPVAPPHALPTQRHAQHARANQVLPNLPPAHPPVPTSAAAKCPKRDLTAGVKRPRKNLPPPPLFKEDCNSSPLSLSSGEDAPMPGLSPGPISKKPRGRGLNRGRGRKALPPFSMDPRTGLDSIDQIIQSVRAGASGGPKKRKMMHASELPVPHVNPHLLPPPVVRQPEPHHYVPLHPHQGGYYDSHTGFYPTPRISNNSAAVVTSTTPNNAYYPAMHYPNVVVPPQPTQQNHLIGTIVTTASGSQGHLVGELDFDPRVFESYMHTLNDSGETSGAAVVSGTHLHNGGIMLPPISTEPEPNLTDILKDIWNEASRITERDTNGANSMSAAVLGDYLETLEATTTASGGTGSADDLADLSVMAFSALTASTSQTGT